MLKTRHKGEKKDKTMSTNKKPASKPEKTIVAMGKTMTEADIKALLDRLAAAEAAKLQIEAEKAALEAKVKTSKARDVKAPSTYDVLQPVFVALRGNIGKNIVPDVALIDILRHAADTLVISLDGKTSKRLFEKTVLHNSCSNIAKAESLSSAEGRKDAFIKMLHQAMVMLPAITQDEWVAYKKEYNTAYDKAISKLK